MKKRIALLILVFTINLSAQIKNEYYENGQDHLVFHSKAAVQLQDPIRGLVSLEWKNTRSMNKQMQGSK